MRPSKTQAEHFAKIDRAAKAIVALLADPSYDIIEWWSALNHAMFEIEKLRKEKI